MKEVRTIQLSKKIQGVADLLTNQTMDLLDIEFPWPCDPKTYDKDDEELVDTFNGVVTDRLDQLVALMASMTASFASQVSQNPDTQGKCAVAMLSRATQVLKQVDFASVVATADGKHTTMVSTIKPSSRSFALKP